MSGIDRTILHLKRLIDAGRTISTMGYLPTYQGAQSFPDMAFYGFPVRLDPSLPDGEIRLEGSDGPVVRVINLGLGNDTIPLQK